MKKEDSFKYFFGAYKSICILSIYGIASIKDISAANEINSAIQKETSKKYIINFNHTDTSDSNINLNIINLKKIIIEKNAQVKFCGLSTRLKNDIIDEGILETFEYANDPIEALKTF